nr:FAD-dependent oxidoreductase [Alphaproteobacteria bacterium]
MTNFDYDLFVIGGGSGGVRAARIAATHGARVGNAEEYRFGGTCVIRGCVPKKLLVYASRFSDDFEDAAGFGWTLSDPSFDWPTLIGAKNKEIARLEAIYQRNLEAAGVAIFAERAELRDAHTIALKSSGRTVSADKILIATGGAPTIAGDADGLEHVITSNEAFDLTELPKRVVIVGGGYIAVEFAGIFHGLGAETTLVYRGDKILRGFDEDLRDGLMAALKERGMNVVTGRNITKVSCQGSVRSVLLDDGQKLEADQVMYATGRKPNTKDLGLEAAGVETGEAGEIRVNDDQQTS